MSVLALAGYRMLNQTWNQKDLMHLESTHILKCHPIAGSSNLKNGKFLQKKVNKISTSQVFQNDSLSKIVGYAVLDLTLNLVVQDNLLVHGINFDF